MLTEKKKEELIASHMKHLDCSREEALDIIETDNLIDHNKRTPYDLDPEKEKIAKKMANVKTRKAPVAYKFPKKERKANPTKGAIIAELADFLAKNSENACENVEIVNKERMISFKIGENTFELTLVQKRKPKK